MLQSKYVSPQDVIDLTEDDSEDDSDDYEDNDENDDISSTQGMCLKDIKPIDKHMQII